jgi:hypothetical protein
MTSEICSKSHYEDLSSLFLKNSREKPAKGKKKDAGHIEKPRTGFEGEIRTNCANYLNYFSKLLDKYNEQTFSKYPVISMIYDSSYTLLSFMDIILPKENFPLGLKEEFMDKCFTTLMRDLEADSNGVNPDRM